MDVSTLKKGDRIRLIKMENDPNPIPPGTLGTVYSVVHFDSDDSYVVNMISWDNGRQLNPCCPPDVVERVTDA